MKEIDFLPARFHETYRQRRQSRQNVAYSLLIGVALVGLHLGNAARLRTAEAALADAGPCDALATANQTRIEALQLRRGELGKRADLLARLQDDAPLSGVLAMITQYLGDRMALRQVRIETVMERAPDEQSSESVRRTQATIGGVATNDVEVGAFYGRLSECPVFEKVEIKYTRQTVLANRQMRAFELTFGIRPLKVHP